jgi:radical SAM superfamily enzyme YgiQ (UPF0313 family)
VANVIEEINYLAYDFNIKGLYFNDDTFGLNKEWLMDFCQSLRKMRFKLVWGCQSRADILSKEMLCQMKKAGCIQVDIGAESGSETVLKNLKKDITPKDTEEVFKIARKVGLKTFATFILGCPGETTEDVKKTEELAKKISSRVSFLILVPYPGSELFKMAKQNNWLRRPNLFFSEEWANKQSENPVMEINFKAEDLLRIRAELQNMFFLRNNLAIFLAFIVRPIYLFGIISCFLKNI